MSLTNSQKTVLNYLRNCGPATARQITTATTVPYATVTLALRRLAADGLATVSKYTWTATPATTEQRPDNAAAPEPPHPTPTPAPMPTPEPATAGPAPTGPSTSAQPRRRTYRQSEPPRLAKGELRAMVLDHLRQHPGQEFGPTALAKALGRADGAVINALNKLAGDGLAIRTQDTPARYQAS